MTEAVRHRIYLVSLAVIALVASYGLIGPDEVPLWSGLVVALLGVGTNALAAKNTSSKLPPPVPRDEDRGESTLMTIVLVLIIVVIALFLFGVYR